MSGHGGRGGGRSPFRPPSPYTQSPPPRLGSPGMNMFGNRLPYMACPRPRWPTPVSPIPHGFSPPPGPRPFRMPMHPPSPAPRGASPEYFKGIHPYSPTPEHFRPYHFSPDFGPPSREFEYVGGPMEPPPLPQNYEPDEEESGPSTAEIIANQSQDYIDEKLAEYQATIYQLQESVDIKVQIDYECSPLIIFDRWNVTSVHGFSKMAGQVLEEWKELSEDFKKLETTNRAYQKKLQEVDSYQKECEKGLQHQKYRIAILNENLKNKKGEEYDELREEILKREAQLHEIQQTLPKESGKYLKIILGNVNVSILNKEEKLKYKSEYENFKLIISAAAFILSIINILFISRRLERLYLFMLVWYYCTLTIRESILKVNGSKIKGWWRAHHFISAFAVAVLLIWPESETWNLFRKQFMVFNAYLTLVQYLQFRYQKGVLYRLKALGEKHNMDITIEGFHFWMWRGLSFLFPFLFVVYFFQLYLSYTLYYLGQMEGATWHVRILSYTFFTLFSGNMTTMFMIIPDKFKRNVKLQYQLLSQRLIRRLSEPDGKKE